MDAALIEKIGLTGWSGLVAVVLVLIGGKLVDAFTAWINQKPAMAQASATRSATADATASGLVAQLMTRLEANERRLDAAIDGEMRCQRRLAVFEAALRDHGIALPADLNS